MTWHFCPYEDCDYRGKTKGILKYHKKQNHPPGSKRKKIESEGEEKEGSGNASMEEEGTSMEDGEGASMEDEEGASQTGESEAGEDGSRSVDNASPLSQLAEWKENGRASPMVDSNSPAKRRKLEHERRMEERGGSMEEGTDGSIASSPLSQMEEEATPLEEVSEGINTPSVEAVDTEVKMDAGEAAVSANNTMNTDP